MIANSQKLILIALLLPFQLAFCAEHQNDSPKASRPNILYLYVDDMGWGSIGQNGQFTRKAEGKPYVLTPNLDKLAAAGVNFRRSYGCTVCSPARSSQQTGFHQGYTFADRNDPNNAKKAIRKEDLTMGDVLSQAGYVTGYWGKWGYGGSSDMSSPTLDNIQTLPTSHGYQYVVAELHHVRAHTFFQPSLWTAPAKANSLGGLELQPNSMAKYQNKDEYTNYPAFQNHQDYPALAYCDDVYAFAALDFVRQQAQNYNQTGQPFFGLFAAQIPHAPFAEVAKLPNWDHDYKDKAYFKKLSPQSQQWCAMVTRIDAHFGILLEALEDPNGDGDKSDSVANNTLVIFQSDNGGPKGSNREQLDANGGLTGSKGSINEGGIRVPTIMRWPAKIKVNSSLRAGSNSDYVLDCTDLLPTFCDLAGVSSPLGIDGVSIAPLLEGTQMQKRRDYLIHEAGPNASIIHGNYKLIRNRKHTKPRAKQNKKHKHSTVSASLQLYDLGKDPKEKQNIAEEHPELVKKLNGILTAERVDESAGFANSYHQWKSKQGSLSDASNWSEYIYENTGKRYMHIKGSPTSSWIATISQGRATADKDTSFLGLEISGSLTIPTNTTVTARNEMRIVQGGTVQLDGGSISSQRWLDIQAGGKLKGYGKIHASLICDGSITLSKAIEVAGIAKLGGEIALNSDADFPQETGTLIPLLKAKSIIGKFANRSLSLNGKKYDLVYGKNSVSMKVK